MSFRAYYEDTDAGGVVYHANYLKFCERGRTEFLHAIGHTNATLREQTGVIFVVRHIDAHYLKPCYLEDELTVRTCVTGLKNTSFTMKQEVFRKNAENPAFWMDIVLVCVDENAKPVRMPAKLKAAMERYLESK
ncbi:MAG: YbgC/FadM family acyl-CoA thioesterase [Rhodospirillales bacterium]|nr:YbgC/FadM family acyl-CoA thioesterase [Rhodospirillales bacterium]